MSDIEFVIKMALHIENPCSDPVRGHNFRADYLIMARDALENIKNPWAKEFLQDTIEKYSKDS